MCGILITNRGEKARLIAHRGIQKGVKELGGTGWKAIHYRLPIQTRENDSWAQPIELDGSRVLLYNGEIFNYPSGYENDVHFLKELAMNRDPITLASELSAFDGFWSVVIFNLDTNNYYAFTDPYSKKQLYINSIDNSICSEIKPLLTEFNRVDKDFIAKVGAFGYVDSGMTPFIGIGRVKPGHICKRCILLDQDSYSMEYSIKAPHDFNLPLRAKISKAVMDRMIGHEPIAVLLSGGLDSTIIAYELIKNRAKVKFYTIENGEDSEYVKLLQNRWNLDVKYITLGKKPELSWVVKAHESPIDLGSVVPQYMLFSNIEEKVVITGDGADELFGGYRRSNYYDSYDQDIEELIHYHLPRLDRMSMKFTKECRNPFLSHAIISHSRTLTRDERTGKKILRDLYRGQIPREILDRPKLPLKSDKVRTDEKDNRYKTIESFKKIFT